MHKKQEPLAQISLFMPPPQIPPNDRLRLKELYEYGVLDTSDEAEFNDIVAMASRICDASMSVIALVDAEREWFKAKLGIDAHAFPRDVSFSSHFIEANNLFFEVSDTLKDERFFDNPLVVGLPCIRFFAGIRLVNKNGFTMGTLMVMDNQPQQLNDDQIFFLQTLAKQVIKLLDQHIINKQLEQQRIKLQQQMEFQNRILSIIAHDVRNPVGAVKSIIELSNKKMLSKQDSAALMQMAAKQIDGTVELLNNLVDWGSMQMMGKGAETEKIHLYTLVSHMYKSFEVIASLKCNIMANLVDDDLFINADINAMRFILRNLISNANKFTKEGVITVYAESCDKHILLSVSDTGVGMDVQVAKKLFDGEQNESSAGTGNEKGSGLGLILTKDFIELLGGSVRVESEIEKGTSLYIKFPESIMVQKKIN